MEGEDLIAIAVGLASCDCDGCVCTGFGTRWAVKSGSCCCGKGTCETCATSGWDSSFAGIGLRLSIAFLSKEGVVCVPETEVALVLLNTTDGGGGDGVLCSSISDGFPKLSRFLKAVSISLFMSPILLSIALRPLSSARLSSACFCCFCLCSMFLCICAILLSTISSKTASQIPFLWMAEMPERAGREIGAAA